MIKQSSSLLKIFSKSLKNPQYVSRYALSINQPTATTSTLNQKYWFSNQNKNEENEDEEDSHSDFKPKVKTEINDENVLKQIDTVNRPGSASP